MKKNKSSKKVDTSIAVNKKAFHDYYLEDTFEAGLSLKGWELKSLRSGRIQLVDSYILVKDGEAWLIGVHITPLLSASTHVDADPVRDRKLLLHKKEIAKLFSVTQQQGLTCIAVKLYWKKHLIKCQIALAKGKKSFDKRDAIKEREWNITKQRLFKNG